MFNKMLELKSDNVRAFSLKYKGFHDSSYRSVEFHWVENRSVCDVSIRLLSLKIETSEWLPVQLIVNDVHRFRFSYDLAFDYPNVRDDIGFIWRPDGVIVMLDRDGSDMNTEMFHIDSDQYFCGRTAHLEEGK